jgi:ABC-type transport system substrate-binding protein
MTLFEGPARTLYPMLALGPLLLLLFSVACGSAAAPTSLPTSTPSLAKAPQPSSIILPTTTPAMTPISPTVSGRDAITLVVSDEPVTLDAFSAQCTGTPELFPCGDYSMDTLTYISEETREVIPLSATEKWEQVAPDRWRFTLRQGVKFHNGEPFDSAAAKYAIDLEGNESIGHLSVSYTGPVSAEVVDPFTVDVVCEGPCPIYPKSAFLTRFQAPDWYQAASEAQRNETTIGFGPY